jgi:hypothetical protein
MAHQRSEEAQKRRAQKRAAREYVITMSYNDALIGEKISRTDPEEVEAFLGGMFGFCDVSAVPCTFKGVVLSDGRGQGVFQK